MFTSPDRVGEYILLEQEISSSEEQIKFPLHKEYSSPINDENLKSQSQSNLGHVVLKAENITARYSPDLPPALRNLSFELISGTMLY